MKLYKNREEIRTDLTNVRYEMGSEAGELAKSSLSSFLKSCFFILLMIILSLLTIRSVIGEFTIPKYRYYHYYEVKINGKNTEFSILEEETNTIIPFLLKIHSEWEDYYSVEEEEAIFLADLDDIEVQEYRCENESGKEMACNLTIPSIHTIPLSKKQYQYQISYHGEILYSGIEKPNFSTYINQNGLYYIILTRQDKNGTYKITIPFTYKEKHD